MIYEVIYKPMISDNFEDHVKNVFKINYQKDCFVYFHFGPKASITFKGTLLTFAKYFAVAIALT